ncbi:MAG: helix-turn-helix transcriptional regulator, partial [Tyzzerella sp.]|nr:helix-turn-helix transcriptional regulator [Tyzzerella sp.]
HRNLSRLFKKNTNKTIKEYLTTAKMNYSIELLRNKDLSILTISEMIGYNSLSHYITTFKKHTGFSPQKYRSELIDGKFLK